MKQQIKPIEKKKLTNLTREMAKGKPLNTKKGMASGERYHFGYMTCVDGPGKCDARNY